MSRINYGRVLGGGLLAGLVMNIGEYVLHELILGDRWAAAMEALGLPEPAGGHIVRFVVLTFLTGIALVWLYAAMRPRFGPGPGTALKAGLAVWFVAWLIPSGFYDTIGLYPSSLIYIALVWGLFEVPISAIAGAWLYQEGGEAS